MLAKRAGKEAEAWNGRKMKHRRQLGLRQGMLGIILLCWVLPVVLIVTLGGVYILDSMTRQYRSDMMRSAQSAAGHHRAQPGFHDRRQP